MPERLFYMHGEATPELVDFTNGLITILICNDGNVPAWRTADTQARYSAFIQHNNSQVFVDFIQKKMAGHPMALLFNDFPYDAIAGYDTGTLAHYCLWANDGNSLTPPVIDTVINNNFPGRPAGFSNYS